MKIYKGAYSEYAIAAFVRAAEVGYPSPEKIKRISASRAVREDLRVVYITFEELRCAGKVDYVGAVMAIYKPYNFGIRIPGHILHERVVAYSMNHAYGEASVYRMLSYARRLFAENRGLSVE